MEYVHWPMSRTRGGSPRGVPTTSKECCGERRETTENYPSCLTGASNDPVKVKGPNANDGGHSGTTVIGTDRMVGMSGRRRRRYFQSRLGVRN